MARTIKRRNARKVLSSYKQRRVNIFKTEKHAILKGLLGEVIPKKLGRPRNAGTLREAKLLRILDVSKLPKNVEQ